MKYSHIIVAVSLILTINSVPALADVLLIDRIESAPAMQTPAKGISMSQVRQQYGDPVTTRAAIGMPPITRWEYEGFSVFFEDDTTLHSVIHQATNN